MKWPLCLALVALCAAPGRAVAGLVVFFDFNDSANLTKDSSGNGNHAINVNSVSYDSSGFSGGAARFNGTNNFLRVNVDVDIDVMPQMTWGAWVLPDLTNGIRAIVSNDNGGFDRNLNLDSRAGGDFGAFRGTGVFDSGIAPSTTQWTFIAAVYNEPSDQMTFYVGSTSFNVSTNFGGTGHTFFQVGHNPSFNEFWGGRIDNVFVYNEALSASQISSLRDSGGPSVQAVPAPGGLALLGAAVLAAGPIAWRRRARD